MRCKAGCAGRAGPGARAAMGAAIVVALLAGCAKSDPKKPLTVDQQASLLKDIRSNPKRAQDLTPAEKEFLRQKLAR